jgi:hypothetical protein
MVMLIIGLVMGVVIPRVGSGLLGDDLRSAVRMAMAEVDRARSEALISGRTWCVIFDLDRGRLGAGPCEDGTAGKDDPDMDVVLRELPASVRLSGVALEGMDTVREGRAILSFFSNGLGTPASLMIRSGEDRGRVLTIKAFNPTMTVSGEVAL